MAAAAAKKVEYDDLTDESSDDEPEELTPKLIDTIMSEKITLNKLLEFVITKNDKLIDSLTKTYLKLSKYNKLIIDADEDTISFPEYFTEMADITETRFSCIKRAVNTRTAELFLFNTFFYFYTLVHPKDLRFFKLFVNLVIDFVTQQQGGNICIFAGEHEVLPREFFINLITGSIIALSYLQAIKCRMNKTSIYSRGLKQWDPKLTDLREDIHKICSFFETIDTKTYEKIIKDKFKIPSVVINRRLKTKSRKGGKRRKKNTHKKRKLVKKRKKTHMKKHHNKRKHTRKRRR